MHFPIALIATILLTLGGIFLVYKSVVNKPIVLNNQPTPVASITPAGNESTPSATTPSPQPSITPSLSPSPKSKKSSTSSTIGSLTVIKNATNNQTDSSSTALNSTISGTINLSGTIPSGTSIVIVARENGSGNSFQTVVSGISASNNATWSWASAKNGVTYDMIAVLKGKSGIVDIDYADSQTYVVTAPALNQIFTINAGFAMSAPSDQITIDCYSHNNNNTWYANVKFASISGAEAYWMQVGSSSGSYDLANVKQNYKSGLSQTVNITVNDSVNYYARYATASVTDPDAIQYSSFSDVTSIKCP